MDTAKLLYRRLDSLFGALDPKKTQPQQLELFLEEAFAQLKDDLRLKAGFLYSERRDDFTLAKTVGDPGGRVAETLDPAAGPLQQVFRHRVYIFGDPNAEIAPYRLGLFPLAAAAGLVVGGPPSARAWSTRGCAAPSTRRRRSSRACSSRSPRTSRATRSPAGPSPRKRWEATSTTSTPSTATCWASPSATPAATGCPRPSWCGTW